MTVSGFQGKLARGRCLLFCFIRHFAVRLVRCLTFLIMLLLGLRTPDSGVFLGCDHGGLCGWGLRSRRSRHRLEKISHDFVVVGFLIKFFYLSFMGGKPRLFVLFIGCPFFRIVQHLISHQLVQGPGHFFIRRIETSISFCLQSNLGALLVSNFPLRSFRQQILHYFRFDRLQPFLESIFVSVFPQGQAVRHLSCKVIGRLRSNVLQKVPKVTSVLKRQLVSATCS